MDELFNTIKSIDSVFTICFDTASRVKGLVYDTWFSQSFDTNNGIWIGSGVADQGVLRISNINNSMYDKLDNSMGYVVQDSYAELVKLINFDENGDSNEK